MGNQFRSRGNIHISNTQFNNQQGWIVRRMMTMTHWKRASGVVLIIALTVPEI